MGRGSKRLIVEGIDDEKVIEHLLRSHKCDDLCEIRKQDGVEELLETIPVLAKGSIEKFGVVLDADDDVAARWDAVRDRLADAGYRNIPRQPVAGGLVVDQAGLPRASVWVMPDNMLPGMLEDFVRLLVPPGDGLWGYAEASVEAVVRLDRRFPIPHRAKAKIHTWLAWQETPGSPMGLAIARRYLDAGRPEAVLFVDWVRRAFA